MRGMMRCWAKVFLLTGSAQAILTLDGCECMQRWTHTGYPPCDVICCNPDSDPGGDWCYKSNATCGTNTWGFCARSTTDGCECSQRWTAAGIPCYSFCCNPDSDPDGVWCAKVDATCGLRNWGHCAPLTQAPPGTLRTFDPTTTSNALPPNSTSLGTTLRPTRSTPRLTPHLTASPASSSSPGLTDALNKAQGWLGVICGGVLTSGTCSLVLSLLASICGGERKEGKEEGEENGAAEGSDMSCATVLWWVGLFIFFLPSLLVLIVSCIVSVVAFALIWILLQLVMLGTVCINNLIELSLGGGGRTGASATDLAVEVLCTLFVWHAWWLLEVVRFVGNVTLVAQAFANVGIEVPELELPDIPSLEWMLVFLRQMLRWISLTDIVKATECQAIRMILVMPLLPVAVLVLGAWTCRQGDWLFGNQVLSAEMNWRTGKVPKKVYTMQKLVTETGKGLVRFVLQQVIIIGTVTSTHLLSERTFGPRHGCPESQSETFLFGLTEEQVSRWLMVQVLLPWTCLLYSFVVVLLLGPDMAMERGHQFRSDAEGPGGVTRAMLLHVCFVFQSSLQVLISALPVCMGLWPENSLNFYNIRERAELYYKESLQQAADEDGDGQTTEHEMERFRSRGALEAAEKMRKAFMEAYTMHVAEGLALAWQLVPLGMVVAKASDYLNKPFLSPCVAGRELVRATGLKWYVQALRVMCNAVQVVAVIMAALWPDILPLPQALILCASSTYGVVGVHQLSELSFCHRGVNKVHPVDKDSTIDYLRQTASAHMDRPHGPPTHAPHDLEVPDVMVEDGIDAALDNAADAAQDAAVAQGQKRLFDRAESKATLSAQSSHSGLKAAPGNSGEPGPRRTAMEGASPPGWEMVLSRSHGMYYYRNKLTGETQWDCPI